MLRFAIPAKISMKFPRKTNECQRILEHSFRICKIMFKILQEKTNQTNIIIVLNQYKSKQMIIFSIKMNT